jgi:hypothetical protein
MTADQFARWQFEHQLIEDLLARIESAERAFLTAHGCPTDVVEIYRILAGERLPPWPRRTAPRDQRRALRGMHVLAHIAQARTHLRLSQDNAPLAARAALLAGLLASDTAAEAALAAKQRKAGLGRGKEIAKIAAAADPVIKKRDVWYRTSETLQLAHPGPVAYTKEKTGLGQRKIQRRRKKLGLSPQRKPRQ